MTTDYVSVSRVPPPRPPGMREWQVSHERPGNVLMPPRSDVIADFDDKEEAIGFAERIARDEMVDLIVEGEHFGGVERAGDWEGHRWRRYL